MFGLGGGEQRGGSPLKPVPRPPPPPGFNGLRQWECDKRLLIYVPVLDAFVVSPQAAYRCPCAVDSVASG